MLEYELIRSDRKSLCLEIKEQKILVRAPRTAGVKQIENFVAGHEDWIKSRLERQKSRLAAHPEPDGAERLRLIERAKEYMPDRVCYYAKIMNLSPSAVTITSAKKRFGSCSGEGRICFSWRLMDYPQEAIDYVIVHELAHLRHMNHGKDFYRLIESVLPDYKLRQAMLKN